MNRHFNFPVAVPALRGIDRFGNNNIEALQFRIFRRHKLK